MSKFEMQQTYSLMFDGLSLLYIGRLEINKN